jgi:hypothetical protein
MPEQNAAYRKDRHDNGEFKPKRVGVPHDFTSRARRQITLTEKRAFLAGFPFFLIALATFDFLFSTNKQSNHKSSSLSCPDETNLKIVFRIDQTIFPLLIFVKTEFSVIRSLAIINSMRSWQKN